MTAPASAAPVVVGIIGAGNVAGQYLSSLLRYPDVAVAGLADLDACRRPERGRRARHPVRRHRGRATRHRRPRAGRQPDDARRARRRRAGGDRVGTAPVGREAVHAGPRVGPGGAGGRAGRRGRRGQRARHHPGRRHPELAAPAGAGCHRRAADRADPHAGPRSRALASPAAVPVRARRRAALRHRPVLPDDAGPVAGAHRVGRGGRAPGAGAARHRVRPGRRDPLPGRGRYPPERDHQVRLRGGRHLGLQLRLLREPAGLRDHRAARDDGGARERL